MILFLFETVTNPPRVKLKNFTSWDEAIEESIPWAARAPYRVAEIIEDTARRMFPKVPIE